MKGRREILFYRIPGSTKGYSFKVNSVKDNIKNCFCIGCLKNCGCTGLKAIGTDFLSDPCGLRHVCRPMKRVERKVKKISKKKIQKKRVKINKEIPAARRYLPTYRPPTVNRDKSKKGGAMEKKHRYRPAPFKEKKPTITMETIMHIKSMQLLDEDFKMHLINRILQADEERRRKRREYRQRKKAEREAAKLLDQSNGHLAETSSSKVQRKARRSNIWYGL
ncbi:hypothetical protein ANCCAN_24194 [Ancylostoma caninum]|uniref:Uncharacterized protein n=1 Tax=Ancylostoma caninum TaxID=29170 RepID=A0A368FD03_ANCCA|nr:hypothetical protein ANCCAN_24194 [Ancylostoma caninum]